MKIMHNRYIKYLVLFMLIIITNVFIISFLNFNIGRNITFEYTVKASQKDTYQVFLGTENEWSEQNAVNEEYSNSDNNQTLNYKIPKDIKTIRVDLGNKEGLLELSDINIKYFGKQCAIEDYIINNSQLSGIESFSKVGDTIKVEAAGTDPFIVIDLSSIDTGDMFTIDKYFNYISKAIMCIIATIIILGISKKRTVIHSLCNEVYKSRTLLWSLAKNDFKTRYAGSYLGVFWAFVQPIITVLIYWFVFQVGFRSAPIGNFPYVLWMISGLVPWFFFSEALLNATNSLLEYSYLVKKVLFKISILPIVKILSALFVHLFFICITILIFALNGFTPSIYMIQLIYYSICALALALSMSLATCAMVLFIRDLGQVINIIMQIGIWMTPIMWNYTMIPEKYRWVLKINPMYYVVEGYRDTLINHVWFLERLNQTIYFWALTLVLFLVGIAIFKKLKPHFSDVL